MRTQSTTQRLVCEIKEYKNYKDYYVTIDGDVFSTKYNTPRRIKPNNVGEYQTVRLSDGNNKKKTIYLHRLVALAFLPKPLTSNHVKHIDGNKKNNSITNLKWYEKKRIIKKTNTHPKSKSYSSVEYVDERSLILNAELSDYIRKIHHAATIKGISKQSNEYDFFHEILRMSLDEYINRYGLKRILVNL